MLTKTQLASLQSLADRDDPTLTLYVDIDQNKSSNRRGGYLVQAEASLKELGESVDDPSYQEAAERALKLLKDMTPKGVSALVAIHRSADLEAVHQLKVPLPKGAYWQRGAFLRHVIEAMDEYERYAVVITDKMHARILTVYMGEVVEHSDLFNPIDGKIASTAKDERWSQARQQRHHDEKVANHVKRVVEALQSLSVNVRFDRLIVAGPTVAASGVARLLPRRLHGKLVETINLPISASEKQVLDKVSAVQERMEREHEREMVSSLLEELHAGGRAAAGLEDVTRAIGAARVWRLFYVRDLAAEGSQCSSCGALIPGDVASCPVCGEGTAPVVRFVDRMGRSVLDAGGQVEVVAGEAAEKLDEVGGVAALLRY